MTRDGEAGVSSVADHAFAAPEGRPWDRCTRCGLGESAHVRVWAPYRPPGVEPARVHAKGCAWPQDRCACRDVAQA